MSNVRRMMMRGGDTTDWKALFAGTVGGNLNGLDVVIPDGVTRIKSWAFYEVVNINNLTVPDSVTTVYTQGLGAVISGVLEIGSGIQLLSGQATRALNCQYVIIRATTPPTLAGLNFEKTGYNIYVPDNSVAAYKAASGWSALADRIKPMSDLVSN